MKINLTSLIIIGLMLFSIHSCKKESMTKVEKVVKEDAKLLKTVEINDYTINYLDIGEGEPVVFVHGTVGDYRVWEGQLDAFSEAHRVIALSRRFAYPNSQEVSDSSDYTVTAHSKDLSAFLKTIDVGPVHLIGHSYGAFTSLLTTLEHPELVKSLTLGEPPVMPFLQYLEDGEKIGYEFAVKALIPAAEAFKSGNDKKAVEIFIGGVLDDTLYFSNAEKKMQDLMMDNVTELKGIAFSERTFPNIGCEDVEKVDVPTLLIKGDKSPDILRILIDELAKCIPNNDVKELTNSSHGLEYENPEEFNQIVLDFVNNK
jgi:pimeloyl-ACP methyl ester carboxylesterase